jgi:CRP-like cAMP-binding protein
MGYGRIGKTSRTFRIIRMARLLRIFRLRETMRMFAERVQSEKLSIVMNIGSILSVLMASSHLMACAWWGIGDKDSAQSWVKHHGYDKEQFSYRYLTSLHWSLSQFAGGMDEVTPHNVSERAFAISTFVVTFIMAGMFISSLTSSMTKLHIITSGQSQKLATLRRFLSQNGISSKLSTRIQRNAQHAFEQRRKLITESHVDLMATISEPLRIELHFEMFAPKLEVHPFFMRYIEQCPQVMRKVCHIAMNVSHICTGDIVFEAGETPSPPRMYIISSGLCQYLSITGQVKEIGQGSWVSEATLWTSWMHLGRLLAQTDTIILELDAKVFQEIVSQFEHPDFDPRLYAREFVEDLNDTEHDLSDLHHLNHKDHEGALSPLEHESGIKDATSRTMRWLQNSSAWRSRSTTGKKTRIRGPTVAGRKNPQD